VNLNTLFERPRLAVDFGTANCIVIHNRRGVVVAEPTVVAISAKQKKIIAVGQEAKIMLGKVPEGLLARRPLKNGGISNYKLAESLLNRFFNLSLGRIRLLKPEVIISVPAGINSVEERAIIHALQSVGVHRIYLLPEPVAAAIGANLPIDTSTGNMIVNIGGGTAEIAVMSLNGIVSYESLKIAGDAINEAIMTYFKEERGVIIGEQTAENIKIRIGSTLKVPESKNIKINVSGKTIRSGQPVNVEVSTNDISDAIRKVCIHIVDAVKLVLSKCPPEIMGDLIDRGMAMSGGTSQLRGFDELLTKSIGIPAYVVEDPLTCVVRGLLKVINNIEEFSYSVRRI
jgi:rod shape-determining protein MreB